MTSHVVMHIQDSQNSNDNAINNNLLTKIVSFIIIIITIATIITPSFTSLFPHRDGYQITIF